MVKSINSSGSPLFKAVASILLHNVCNAGFSNLSARYLNFKPRITFLNRSTSSLDARVVSFFGKLRKSSAYGK